MASASELLAQVETAYSALLVALATPSVQEYQLADGRKIVRADFPATLEQLRISRATLQREARGGRGVRLGRISRPSS